MAGLPNSTEVAPVKSAKRKVGFDGPRITRSETEFDQASPTWKTVKGKRVYYGENEVQLSCNVRSPISAMQNSCLIFFLALDFFACSIFFRAFELFSRA